VLKQVNLTVKPGQFVALVGPSGSGKSTSVSLIERFYDVIGGSLLIDGIDIRSYNITSLRSHIGLVSQEPNLFDMSIKENIIFGCDTMPSNEVIEQAAKDANIHEVTRSSPIYLLVYHLSPGKI
jgi:ATP-binding cassette subfamily B (MDR/TAP) protein 1